MIADVLAAEANPSVSEIWTPEWNLTAERELWVEVMEAQADLGLDIPGWAIDASRHFATYPPADSLQRINDRELVTRHDLKARLEIFCEQAGHEYHHLGMTSADVVDNVTQIRMLRCMELFAEKYGIWLPSQGSYQMRGIKGAVGTHQDQLDLLGSVDACYVLDDRIAQRFGFDGSMIATGQVYPRSQDLHVISELTSAVALRLTPARRPLFALLVGFQAMCAGYAGDQWNEGDVSTSMIRRYCLPGAWRAASLIMDTKE